MSNLDRMLEKLKRTKEECEIGEQVNKIILDTTFYSFWVECFSAESAQAIYPMLSKYYYRPKDCQDKECRNFNCMDPKHVWSYTMDDVSISDLIPGSSRIYIVTKLQSIYWGRRNLLVYFSRRKFLIQVGIK